MLFCAVKEYTMLKNRFLLYTLFIALLFSLLLTFTGCAKRGAITGGLKDTIPPVMVGSSPRNMSTQFKGNEIRIDFDEYIKIKDVNKQLIISPPMNEQPDIIPMGNASKFISIKIKDTLEENTTYSFNFGQSIIDNNEGNPYSQFRFVFSTGAYIDSLTLNGRIKDAYSKDVDNFVTVMLYEANEKFNDSTIYKEKPRYVTNTLDSMVNYSLQNLKEGKYHLFALKDKNNNYRYDPKTDKIAFLPYTVSIPTDTVYLLELFKEQPVFKPGRVTQASSNRLYIGHEGKAKNFTVDVKNGTGTEDIRSLTTNVPDKDSLQVWLPRDIQADSLKVIMRYNDSIKEFTPKFKEMKAKDSLTIEAVQRGNLHFRDKFTLKTATPVVNIDSTKISLIDKDSVAVRFSLKHIPFEQRVEFDFEKEENQKYNFTMMPGAFEDFYGKQNDTLNYKLSTRSYADYGNLRINLQNVDRFPIILEITDPKGKVIASEYSEGETQINFDLLEPNGFTIRLIYDDNGNGVWDSGSYMDRRQPEEVIYLQMPDGKPVDVRANWDVEQPFILPVR